MAEHFLQFQTAAARGETVQAYEVLPRHAKPMGFAAMEGFALMEAIQSPWEELRTRLQERVTDQEPAIDAIIDALDTSAARSVNDKRPMANLAFLGPTGVGKSETAKTLAEFLRNGNPNLIKINCSEYANGHEVTNLTGAPLSYVGYDKTPRLAKERVEKPGTVVLFDEIEKGSTELYDLMLQIMGDGELQMSDGDVTYFRNSILIMTSNLGANKMADMLSPTRLGFRTDTSGPDRQGLEHVATEEFNRHFRTEFLNRLDKRVVFHPLSSDGLGRVLDTKLDAANREYEYYHGAKLTLSEAAREVLVQEALTEPHLGARPVVRAFERNVQTVFGRYLGARAIPEGTHVKVFHPSELDTDDDGQLLFASRPDSSLQKRVSTEPVKVEPEEEPTHMQAAPLEEESEGE